MLAIRIALIGAILLSGIMTRVAHRAADGDPIASLERRAGGTTFHYLAAGEGPPLILLHGFTETAEMWRAVMPRLAREHRVIAPDLPGFGGSSIPEGGLDMKTAAERVHELVRALGVTRAVVVGHDIGLMVAYAYAALFPSEVEKLVLMDAFLPGVGAWEAYAHNPKRWHFTFNGPTAEALVAGRERVYLDHFWNDFAADPSRSLPEGQRAAFTAAYARPGRMRAAWSYFRALSQTAADFGALARQPLPMPVLVLAGQKAAGPQLAEQVARVATRVTSVVLQGAGHWLVEERPSETLAALEAFLRTS